MTVDLPMALGGFLSTTPGILVSSFPCTACKGSPQPQTALGHVAGALQHHFSLSSEQNNKIATIKGKIKIPSFLKERDRLIVLKMKLLFLFQEIYSLSFTQTLSILECLERKYSFTTCRNIKAFQSNQGSKLYTNLL